MQGPYRSRLAAGEEEVVGLQMRLIEPPDRGQGERGVPLSPFSVSKKASAFLDTRSLRFTRASAFQANTLLPREVFFHRQSRQKNDLICFRFLRKTELCEAF